MTRPRRWPLALAACIVAASAALAQTPAKSIPSQSLQEFKMSLSNASFERVPLNSRERNACSPAEPALPWRGIVIQAPSQVAYQPGKPVDGQFAAIPICGFYRLDMDKLLDSKGLVLVAVNVEDKTRYSGLMIDQDAGLMEEDPDQKPLDPARMKGMLSAAWFNPNLARYVQLPAAPAVYHVHAEYGGMVSNEVQIALIRR